MIIDRVEIRDTERILRFVRYALGAVFIAPILFIIWNWEKVDSLRLSDFKPFIPIVIVLAGLYLQLAMRKRGQFIEWSAGTIEFDTQKVKGKVEIDNIKEIHQSLDIITITLKNNENYHLNIQDFTKYEMRMRIKNNFNKVLSGRAV